MWTLGCRGRDIREEWILQLNLFNVFFCFFSLIICKRERRWNAKWSGGGVGKGIGDWASRGRRSSRRPSAVFLQFLVSSALARNLHFSFPFDDDWDYLVTRTKSTSNLKKKNNKKNNAASRDSIFSVDLYLSVNLCSIIDPRWLTLSSEGLPNSTLHVASRLL